MDNRAVGLGLLLLYGASLVYYGIWTVALPFVDPDHRLWAYFPDHYYAHAVPVLFAYSVFSLTFAYVALLLIRTDGDAGRGGGNSSSTRIGTSRRKNKQE